MSLIQVFLWTLATCCVLHLELSPAKSLELPFNGVVATFKVPENLRNLYYNPYFRRIAVDVSTGFVYIGADNWIFQLDANLKLLASAKTAPDSSFYTECYSKRECKEKGVEGEYMNTVLVVNRDFNELITCGPVYINRNESTCTAWNLANVTKLERKTPAIASDYYHPVAFIAPGISEDRKISNVLYVASSYEADSFGRVSRISRHNIDAAANLELTFSTAQYPPELEQRIYGRYYQFIHGFSSGGFSYFLAEDRFNLGARLIRICQNDSEFGSYADVQIQCLHPTGIPIRLIKAAYLGHPGRDLAHDLNVTVDDEVLFVTFGGQYQYGALCIFSMQTIRETFRKNVAVSRTHTEDTDQEFCGENFSVPFRGDIPVETVATLFQYHSLYSVISTTRGAATVVFVQSSRSGLEKVLILGSSTAVKYYSSNDFGITSEDWRFCFDSYEQHFYLIDTYSRFTVFKASVHYCSYLTRRESCIKTVDPLCGWCTAQNRCTSEDSCFQNGRKESSSSDNEGWTTCRIKTKQQLQVTTGEPVLVDSPIAEHIKIPTNMKYSADCFRRVNCTFSNVRWEETSAGQSLKHGVFECPLPKTSLATCSKTLQLEITIDKTSLISNLTHQRNVTFFNCSCCESQDNCHEPSCTWSKDSHKCNSAPPEDPVNCHSHLERCHFNKTIDGGVWRCQENTEGYKCDRCKPTFYLHPNRNITDEDACWPCNCDLAGSLPNTTCDSKTDAKNNLETGKCHCKTFVTGRGCDECQIGYWNLTSSNQDGCQACTCNDLGTLTFKTKDLGCDMYDGTCPCKRNVMNPNCDRCRSEHFGLSEEPLGCKPCDCDAGGSYDNDCDIVSGQCKCRPNFSGRACSLPSEGYWAPQLGRRFHDADKITKNSSSIPLDFSEGAIECNCDVIGSRKSTCDPHDGQCECKWHVVGRTCGECAPGTFDLGPEGCRNCHCNFTGSLNNTCDQVTGQCNCKLNFDDLKCDQCRRGHWNFPKCQQCECNGHAESCDSVTGNCIDCRDSTTGMNCGRCVDGAFGNPTLEKNIACRPCTCPGTADSGHSFANKCSLDSGAKSAVCECQQGYGGALCDSCAENYYGQPNLPGGFCRPCQCNNNTDLNSLGNCDSKTGKCLKCLYNTAGDNCQLCEQGYEGDALKRKCIPLIPVNLTWIESSGKSGLADGNSVLRFDPGEPVLLNCDVAPQITASEVRYVVETVDGTSVTIETLSIQSSPQVMAFLTDSHNGGKLGCRAEVEDGEQVYESSFAKLELIASDSTEEAIFDLNAQLYVWCNDSEICSLQTKDDILDFAMDASSNFSAIRMNPPEMHVFKKGNMTQKPKVIELPETISMRSSKLKSAVIRVDPLNSQVIWTHSPDGHLWLTNVETGTSLPLKKDFGVVQMDVNWKEKVVFGVSEKDRKCILKLDLRNTSSVASICVNEAITSIAVGHEHIYYVTESGKTVQRNPKNGYETEVFKGHQNSNVIPRSLVALNGGNVSWVQDFFGKISVIYALQPPKSSSEKPRRSRYVFKGLIRGIGQTKMAHETSSCLKCSHFCNPGSRSACICPWRLEIENETQCTGKWIHVASTNASTKYQTNLMTYDFSSTRENRHPVVLNSSRVELMPQSHFGESRCFIRVNEVGSTELVFRNTTTDLIIGFDSILQVLPSSNPVKADVIFFNNSCIRILHTKNNETWTLFCGPIDAANVVVDSKSWIVFWEHETDKSVHMTKLPSLVTRKIIEAKDFETAKKAEGRLALDSNSKVLYWIHGNKIWSRRYEISDSPKPTSLWNCTTTTPKRIQFHAGFLYWTETGDNTYDKIAIFDLEFRSKQTLITSSDPGFKFKSFAVQSDEVDQSPGPIQCEGCSHFCKESLLGEIPEKCWCPNEKPILASNGTCYEPNLNVVQATEIQNIFNVTNTRNHEKVIRQISTEATAGTKVFASNGNVQCWLQGPQNQVICTFLTADGNETTSVLGSAHSTNPLLSLSSTKNFVIFNTGNETGKYASLILANATNGEKLEFEAMKEDQRNPFAFDHRRKLAVWCTDRELKFHEVGGSHLDSHEVSIETDFCDKNAKTCTSLALDEENGRAYFIYGNQIKRLDYDPKTSTSLVSTLYEMPYSRANTLSFDGNGNLFWAGGFADFGEFVDMIKVPENPGEMVASIRVLDNGKRTIVQVEAERNVVNATRGSSFNDTCSSHDCEHFCFPENRWTLDGAKCYCPTEIPPDGAKTSKCEPLYKKQIHAEGETITQTVENENEKDDSLLKILIGACSGVVVLGLIIFGLIIRKRRGNQEEDYKKALALFLDGDQDSANMIENPAERSYYVPFSKVIPPEDINLTDAKQLGSGQFGAVFLAKYKEESVAIKIVKHGSDREQMKEFLKEIKIMAYIGDHAHIVQMYGAEVSNLENGGVLVVLELCPHGDLETFLRKHKNNFNSSTAAGTSKNEVAILAEDDQNSLNFSNLVDWSRQIAHGLAYLEEKQVVHGDLATRNALLFDNNVVKVSDFGFSRKTYGKQYTKANKQTPLPFRWAAPETLDQMTFSTQTDVWSYGVTVWEIFTLGNCPFAQQSWDLTFSTRLREGMRLEKPELATDEIYDRLMMHCWQINPDDRPTFVQVCEFWNEFCNHHPVNSKYQENVRYVIT